jgi:RNA polymerase sigma-70 factor (ECF subfamily)
MDEDKQIIEKILAGDTELFRIIIDKYKEKVLGIIYSFCGNTSDNEDIAQAVFIKVFRALDKFKFESAFSTWLYRIVINESITIAKKKKAKYNFVPLQTNSNDDDDESNIIDFIEAKEDNIESQMLQKDTQNIVQTTLAKLKDNYRTVITLRDIEDFSYEEIANMLNISITQVKIYLFRARNKMRSLLLQENLL